MVKGKDKGEVPANALLEPQNFNEFTFGLSIGKNFTWMLDLEVRKTFEKCEPLNNYNTKIILV